MFEAASTKIRQIHVLHIIPVVAEWSWCPLLILTGISVVVLYAKKA